MARYTGPVCRLCRREGMKLFLKGDRCHTDKCGIERRPWPPGMHGQRRRKKTDYAVQLREKQKVRRIYGLMEKQFRRYFERAERQKGVTGANFLRLLERRLDNVVYRLGFASSRNEARQLVRHAHFLLNGRKVDVPSILVRPGDVIEVREKSKNIEPIERAIEARGRQAVVRWLEVDVDARKGKVLAMPEREDIDMPIEEHLIVEFYSK